MVTQLIEEKPRVASVPVGAILKNTSTDITDKMGQQNIPPPPDVIKNDPREILWEYLKKDPDLYELQLIVANMEYLS